MDLISVSIPVLARFLIGFYFVFFGARNIYYWTPTLNAVIQKKIPLAHVVFPISIAWQLINGCLIIVGLYVQLAALLLIPYTIIAVCIFHNFWKFEGELRLLNFIIFTTTLTVTLSALLLLIYPI